MTSNLKNTVRLRAASSSAKGNPFAFMGLPTLGRLLRQRKISSLELTRACLDAIEKDGSSLNALAEVTRAVAERQARAADQRIAAGETLTRIAGIPFGAKDLLATAGIPTRWGSRAYANQRFDFDATVIDRLQHANAVLVAKLAMVELAGAGRYRRPAASLTGPGLNPWNRGYWSGGSSSGSAAAVCAGLVPFSLGSETGGSILIPASFCGVTGFRPSFGAVSRYGAMAVSWSMDKIGPIARSAEECEIILRRIAGPDLNDPSTAEFAFLPLRSSKLRLGVLPMDLTRFPATAAAFSAAIELFSTLGFSIKQLKLPNEEFESFRTLFQTLFAAECGAAHSELINSPQIGLLIDDQQRQDLLSYRSITVSEYVQALQQRMAASRQIRSLFHDVDAVLAPTVVTEATKLDEDVVEWSKLPHYAILGAIAGIPGLSIPMGVGPNGLPLGLSIQCDLAKDRLVLMLGKIFQRASNWHLRRPDLSRPDSRPARA